MYRACLIAAPIYPLVAFAVGVSRNLVRLWPTSPKEEEKEERGLVLRFIETQWILDASYVVVWDTLGIIFKGVLVLGLCTRGFDSWG